jgi:hypothetical protein
VTEIPYLPVVLTYWAAFFERVAIFVEVEVEVPHLSPA